MTHNTNRKYSIPRKYSLDNQVIPLKCKFMLRNVSYDNSVNFHGCRPWSPADVLETTFITDDHNHIIWFYIIQDYYTLIETKYLI